MTITLGDREFTIRPFTFDELRAQIDLFRQAEKPIGEGGFEAARTIIATALQGQIGNEELADLRVTLHQVVEAVRTIGVVSGLYVPVSETKPGEPVAQVES